MLEDALHELLAQAGDAKDVLDDQHADQDADHGGAQDADHRHQGIAQGVPERHDPLAQALGAGGTDVVLLDDLEHAGAGDAGDLPGGVEPDRQGRQPELTDGAVGAGPHRRVGDGASGHAAQEVGEDHDAQPGDHEARHRVADHREAGEEVVDPGVLADGGEDTEGHSDADGDDQRSPPELAADAQLAEHERGDLLATDVEGDPEVAMDRPLEEVPVLDQHRLVQPVLMEEELQRPAVHPLADEGVAGEGVDHHEDDEGDDQQGQHDDRQPLGDVDQRPPGHLGCVLPAYGAGRPARAPGVPNSASARNSQWERIEIWSQ